MSTKRMRERKQRERVERSKSHTGRNILLLMVVVLVIALGYSWISSIPASPTPGPVAVTDFNLPEVGSNGLTGRQISLSSFYGKVIVLEFMEPWCEHCQNMAPVMDQLYQQYGPQGVVFVSVAGPWSGATADDAAKFIQTYHATGTNAFFLYDSSQSAFNAYRVTSTPTYYIIGRDLSITSTFEGEVTPSVLAADINAALQTVQKS